MYNVSYLHKTILCYIQEYLILNDQCKIQPHATNEINVIFQVNFPTDRIIYSHDSEVTQIAWKNVTYAKFLLQLHDSVKYGRRNYTLG